MKNRILALITTIAFSVVLTITGCGGGGGGGGGSGSGGDDNSQPVEPTSFSIIEHAPHEGAAGTAVLLSLDSSIAADAERLKVYYNNNEAEIIDVIDSLVQIRVPDTLVAGTSGKISLGIENLRSNEVDFQVVVIETTQLFSQAIASPSEEQTVNFDDKVKVRIPAGVLSAAQTLTISEVKNIAANPLLPFETNAIDISIGDLHELGGAIEIGIKYDPDVLAQTSEEDLAFYKWDELYQIWLPLAFRLDTSEQMIYLETDHLCVIMGGSVAGVVGLLGAVITPPLVAAGVYEMVTYTTYATPQKNFRIVYHRSSFDKLVPSWPTPSKLTDPVSLHPSHPIAIAEIGALFERALGEYAAAGLKSPVFKPGWFWGEDHTPITVKISGVYGALTDEPVYEKVFGAIHLPAWLFQYYAEGMDPSFEQLMYLGIGHELFHTVQAEYYRAHRMMKLANTGDYWWIEAAAEYAGARLAWGGDSTSVDKYLDLGIHANYFSQQIRSIGRPASWSKDYEYAAAQFVRFIVDVKGLNFKQLIEHVATGDPLVTLNNFILSKDSLLHPGGGLGAYYQQFARWGMLSKESFLKEFALADFESPTASRLSNIAWQANKMDKTILTKGIKIEVSGGKNSLIDYFVLPEGERAAGIPTPLRTLVSEDKEELDAPKVGDVVYLLAVNYGSQVDEIKADVALTKLKDANDPLSEMINESVATHNFIMSAYSAQLWAIKIGGEEDEEIITTSFAKDFATRWENPAQGGWVGESIVTDFLISGTMIGSKFNNEASLSGSFLGEFDLSSLITLRVNVRSNDPIKIEAAISQPFSQWDWEWIKEREDDPDQRITLSYLGAPAFKVTNTKGEGTHPITLVLGEKVGEDDPVYTYFLTFEFDPTVDFPDHSRFRVDIEFPFFRRDYIDDNGEWKLDYERPDWKISPASLIVEMRDQR